MEQTWRILVDEALPGVENMARDAALLEEVESSAQPLTVLRFYRWMIPTLSLGNKQVVEKAANLEFCRRNGIDIVRRPTGGAAVLHHLELTYSIVSNDRGLFPSQTILDTYLSVSRGLCRGLEILGLPASMVEKKVNLRDLPENYVLKPTPCFSTASQYELLVEGKKVIGSAQKRTKGAFLQHGSIPYNYDWKLQAGAMMFDEVAMRETMTCIGDHLSPLPNFRQLVEAFLQGFAEVFRVKLSLERMTDEELIRARQLLDLYKVVY